MRLWLHDQIFQPAHTHTRTHTFTHTCAVEWTYQSLQWDQLAVHCKELIDPMLNGQSVCVYVCACVCDRVVIDIMWLPAAQINSCFSS